MNRELVYLLTDIRRELLIRLPHTSKLKMIDDMLSWLDTGSPCGEFAFHFPSQMTDEGFSAFEREQFWENPYCSCYLFIEKYGSYSKKALVLNALEYRPLYTEAGMPSFFWIDKEKVASVTEALLLLLSQLLAHQTELPHALDSQVSVSAFFSTNDLQGCARQDVLDEIHWHCEVAIQGIALAEHTHSKYVGIYKNGEKQMGNIHYENTVDTRIHRAMKITNPNQNPSFFYEADSAFVIFGS